MTEKQQEKVLCENNWVRRTAGVKRINKQRMEEPREEGGVRECHEEAGEELATEGWTCGKNGRGTVEMRLEWRAEGEEEDKTEMGGPC